MSGPLTRQLLCAARLALNLPFGAVEMAPGSDEEELSMAADIARDPLARPDRRDGPDLEPRPHQLAVTVHGDFVAGMQVGS